jgi:hypothetical protein
MVLDTSLFVLTVRGKEKLIDLGRPVHVGDNSITSVVWISESDSVRQDIMARSSLKEHIPIASFQPLSQKKFNHVSVTVVEHLLQEFWRTIEEICEIAGLNHSVELIIR